MIQILSVQSECKDMESFMCSSGECLEILKVCDGVADCPNKDDEIDCANKTVRF